MVTPPAVAVPPCALGVQVPVVAARAVDMLAHMATQSIGMKNAARAAAAKRTDIGASLEGMFFGALREALREMIFASGIQSFRAGRRSEAITVHKRRTFAVPKA